MSLCETQVWELEQLLEIYPNRHKIDLSTYAINFKAKRLEIKSNESLMTKNQQFQSSMIKTKIKLKFKNKKLYEHMLNL